MDPHKFDMKLFGERVRVTRQVRGISQTALADRVGVKKQTLYKYEKGIVDNVPLGTLFKICDTLSVSPLWVMGWSSETTDNTANDAVLREFRSLSSEKQLLALDLIRALQEER